MKINEQALEALKECHFTGDMLIEAFENLIKELGPEIGEIAFTIGFDKDDAAPIGEFLPEIMFRLKEKKIKIQPFL